MLNNSCYSAVIDSPIGHLGIITHADRLIKIDFLYQTHSSLKPTTALAKKVVQQLNKYFVDSKFIFDLPLEIRGTPFQQKIWQALQMIPLGKAFSYGDLAKEFDTGPRAIGSACRNNRIPIIIPCHRIIASNGLGGFSGAWQEGEPINIKAWLLKHEGVTII